jgi:hypothetical protein
VDSGDAGTALDAIGTVAIDNGDRSWEEALVMKGIKATAIQTEVPHQRSALMWAQMIFDQRLKVWSHIEGHETLACEDKVGGQVGLL